MKQPVYIVTGATGHLGNTVVRELVRQGRTVRCLMLEKERPESLRGVDCDVYTGDITDPRTLDAIFSGLEPDCFYVLHLASMITISSRYNRLVETVNVEGTKNILAKARQYGARRFLYCSSVHAIPEKPHGEVITEVDAFDPDLVHGIYAKTKAEATRYVLDAGREGFDVVVVHPSGLIGPNDYLRGKLVQVVLDFVNHKLNTLVKGGYDIVDVRDVADGLIAALHEGKSGECYLLTNTFYTLREIIRMLSDITGTRPIRFLVPFILAKWTAPLVEWWGRVRGKAPLYTPYSLYTLSSNSNFSHEKADRELGYKTRPMMETLNDTVAFLDRQNRFERPLLRRPDRLRN